jgi:uncharacterized protein YggE
MRTLLALLGLALLPIFSSAQATFTGTATRILNADELIITVGVTRESKDPKVVFEQTRTAMAGAIAYLNTKKGVKKVETQQINLYNRYANQAGVGASFVGSQSLTVTLSDFSLYDEVMLKLIDLGLNNIGQVRFAVSTITQIKQEVQLDAIKAAKKKAELYSEELGVRLVKIISFAEDMPQLSPTPYANYKTADAGVESQTSLAPNQVDVTMSVTLVYVISPKE